ncbi:MAG: SUMF1/EgtB/PvdO family nonheme iron enzyme [Planctomycetota bacterium]|nr:SUMF1/EgtB/PvdO family nonheme iron enzyme [Planctomycetota bacterium]
MPHEKRTAGRYAGPALAAILGALAVSGGALAQSEVTAVETEAETAAGVGAETAAGVAAGVGAGVGTAAIVVEIPKTTLSIELVPVEMPDGTTLLVTRREIAWPLYDTYVHGLDQENPAMPDDAGMVGGVTRPTKPYINMDRGWGHTNYPAMGMSHLAAQEFCTWLGHKTGRTFRLPTEAEWEAIAEQSGTTPDNLDARAWHLGNTDDTTRPRATKDADDLGLYDLLGNVGEWCTTDPHADPAVRSGAVARGGSYMDEPELLSPKARQRPHRSWNSTDPQIPKSIWWLADCTWVGIRPVCVPDDPTNPSVSPDEALSPTDTPFDPASGR